MDINIYVRVYLCITMSTHIYMFWCIVCIYIDVCMAVHGTFIDIYSRVCVYMYVCICVCLCV